MSASEPLEKRVLDPGFTPSIREAHALFDLIASAEESLRGNAERAALRIGEALLAPLVERIATEKEPGRAHLVHLLGRLGAPAEPHLLALLQNTDGKSRRNAIAALGANRSTKVESILIEMWKRGVAVEDQRAIVRTLAKIGTDESLDLVSTASTNDAELKRLLANAKTALSRTLTRSVGAEIDLTRTPAKPVTVVLFARDGIEEIVEEEAARWDAHKVARGRVHATLNGNAEALFGVRTMLRFGFPLTPRPLTASSDLATELAEMLTSKEAQAVFDTFTKGRKSFRIAWADGGHRRSVVWACAQKVTEKATDLVNDPSESAWEALVRPFERELMCDLIPRKIHDPRFTYRETDVQGASHPTVAAALAYMAGVREKDVVWDPFVGSGTELIERAKLGGFAELVGTDVNAKAIESAKKNAAAAGVDLRLECADATQFTGVRPTTILTNPPLGKRVLLGESREVVRRFLAHAATLLPKGGQLVWVSPDPDFLGKQARASGLARELDQSFDMGGFPAVMERWRKV